MGQLIYGYAAPPITLDDRVLQYVQTLTATKMRRHESFTLTVVLPDGTGTQTLWMQPAIPMRFTYDRAEGEKLDMSLLRTLFESASSASGITVDPRVWAERELADGRQLAGAAQ